MRRPVVAYLILALGASAALPAACGGTTGTTNGTGGAGGSTSTSAACMPASGDDACTACTKGSCCGEATACQGDLANCECWAQCYMVHPGDYSTCLKQCPQPDATTQALSSCVAAHCGGPCNGTSTSSSSSGGILCMPMASDPPCTLCTKSSCCSQVDACAADSACLCWTNCIAQGGSTTSCSGSCGAMDATTAALFSCSATMCQGKCT